MPNQVRVRISELQWAVEIVNDDHHPLLLNSITNSRSSLEGLERRRCCEETEEWRIMGEVMLLF